MKKERILIGFYLFAEGPVASGSESVPAGAESFQSDTGFHYFPI